MEILLAIIIVALAALGLGFGLMFGRGPVMTSCGAAQRLAVGRCADCPLRKRAKAKDPQ